MGSKFEIGFDEPGFGKVLSLVFLDLGLGWHISGQTDSKFGLFGGVRKGIKFGFVG